MTLRSSRAVLVVTVVGLVAATAPSHTAPRPDPRVGRALVPASSPRGSGPSLGYPQDVAVDAAGVLVIADRGSVAMLTVDPLTGDRTIVSDAMHGSGPPLPYDTPQITDRITAVALLPSGDVIVSGTRSLTRIDRVTGGRALLSASGVRGSGPGFGWVGAVALEPGGTLIVADSSNRTVIRVDPATGDRTLVSGCQGFGCVPVGTGTPFTSVNALTIETGGALLVADSQSLVRVDPSTGDRTLLSGPTKGSGPALPISAGLAVAPSGDVLWGHAKGILRVDPNTGDRLAVSNQIIGGGPAFRTIEGLTVDPAGTLLVADADLGALLRVDPVSGDRAFVSGGPVGTGPRLDCVGGVDVEASGTLVIPDCLHGIMRVDPRTGDRTMVSDALTGSGPRFVSASDIAVEPSGMLLVPDAFTLKRVHPTTGDRTVVSNGLRGGHFLHAASIALEAPGIALVGDRGLGGILQFLRIYLELQFFSGLVRVDLATGSGEIVSGGGLLSGKRGAGPGWLFTPIGPIAVESGGNAAVGRDRDLLQVDLATGDRRLVSGLRSGSGPPLEWPGDVAVEPSGAWLAVDYWRPQVVRVDPATGARSVVSGIAAGSGPQLDRPRGLLIEADGTLIVVNEGDSTNFNAYPLTTVVRVDPATGDRTVLSRY